MPSSLKIDAELPPGALLGTEAETLAAQIAAAGGAWYRAEPDRLECDDNLVITRWLPRAGSAPALPVEPNHGNTRFGAEPGSLAGLRHVEGRHCGFWVPAIRNGAEDFSFAVQYHAAPGAARTLLTMKLQKTKEAFFLVDQEGMISFRTRSGVGGVALPAGAAMRDSELLVAGYSSNVFRLRHGGEIAMTRATAEAETQGPADLFIGCRGNRSGLLKTLGASSIASVFFWPFDILDPDNTRGAHQLAAIENYRFWEG